MFDGYVNRMDTELKRNMVCCETPVGCWGRSVRYAPCRCHGTIVCRRLHRLHYCLDCFLADCLLVDADCLPADRLLVDHPRGKREYPVPVPLAVLAARFLRSVRFPLVRLVAQPVHVRRVFLALAYPLRFETARTCSGSGTRFSTRLPLHPPGRPVVAQGLLIKAAKHSRHGVVIAA